MSTRDAVLGHLHDEPTIGLRDLGKAVGVSRTAAHRAIRQLAAAGAITVLEVGVNADTPSRYAVTGQ